jgi:hypothetical protein
MLHALCRCRQLAVLRMGWNTLGPKGGRALAEGLKYSSTLQQLLLPWSGIGDAGASHIAKALESNSSVRLLDLSGCQVRGALCCLQCRHCPVLVCVRGQAASLPEVASLNILFYFMHLLLQHGTSLKSGAS